jgi:anti-anti-sigma factor
VRIDVREFGDVRVLDLSGRLAIGAGDRDLREAFQGLLDRGGRKFVFNFLKVSYVDSAGLGETVACHKRASEHDAEVRLVLKEKGKPEEVFVLTCLDRVFPMHRTVEEAVSAFSA